MSILSIPQLSPVQDQVIVALANGATLTDAAETAGVHRNTIGNWRRSSPEFRAALADARYDRAILVRERADQLAGRAIYVIEEILSDTKIAPSIRLKAALAIVNLASTPPPESPALSTSEVPSEPTNAQPEIVPNSAQMVPNSAQMAPNTYIRTTAKTGRNEPCPCNSGRKFKQCCLNQPSSAAAAGHTSVTNLI